MVPDAHASKPAALPLIQAAELQRLLSQNTGAPSGAPPPLRVVDLRWAPAGPSSLDRYREAHIPTAVHMDLDKDLAAPGGPGRHPFPSVARFAEVLGSHGIGPGTYVVAYDDGHGAIAARLWYMLRVHGHASTSVLEGGLAAWRAAGLPLVSGDEGAEPTSPPALRLDESRVLDRATVRRLLLARGDEGRGKPLLLDARARARYRGDVEPLDKRAGHIPGAVNAPYEENLVSAAEPRFKPAADLRRLYEGFGVPSASEVVVSCGSGVTACHDAIALEVAGFPLPKLYVGSFSEWSATDGEPVATGDAPGRLER